MPPKAKAKAKPKTRRVLAIDKYAKVPRDMHAAARLLDDRDLVKRAQKALNERHARDDRIDSVPAGGEQVETLAKKVEDMETQMKAMGGTVRPVSAPRSRSPRRERPATAPRADGSLPSSESGHVCRDGGETCGVP